MKTITVANDSTSSDKVLFQTLPSGDVEIVESRYKKDSTYTNSQGQLIGGTYGGMFDEQICSIPKSKIPELITFLQGVA